MFIDESGDPGFKIERGSSPIFVTAMVILENGDDARRTEGVIREAKRRLGVKPEFKFTKLNAVRRDEFFAAVSSCPFTVRAIVVQKDRVYSPHLRADKEDFFRFFVRQMMTYDGGALVNARVVIDGSGDRVFKRKLNAALRSQVGEKIRDVRFSESQGDVLVQLADMCAGAIARSYRTDRKGDPWRWRNALRPRIRDVWDFQ